MVNSWESLLMDEMRWALPRIHCVALSFQCSHLLVQCGALVLLLCACGPSPAERRLGQLSASIEDTRVSHQPHSTKTQPSFCGALTWNLKVFFFLFFFNLVLCVCPVSTQLVSYESSVPGVLINVPTFRKYRLCFSFGWIRSGYRRKSESLCSEDTGLEILQVNHQP